ncbi:MAG: BatD family protein [Steroidobacteraceae bacterium]
MRSHARSFRGCLAAIALCAFNVGVGHAAAPSVDATIEPSQIEMGDSAQLTITTSGNGSLSVALPVVSGLEFRVVGQSRQIEMINGATLESTSTIVRVTPEEPGVFTIPGPTPHSPPMVLRVTPSNGNGSLSSPNGGASPGLAPLLPGGANSNVHLTPDGSAFVSMEIPKHELYVGESVPVEIQVGMRDGFVASINGLPKLNSDDFTLNNLSRQPEHGAKTVAGQPFTVYTWHSLLAAVKPGSYSLGFETPMTVRVRTRSQRDSLLDDLLGDPFLQNVFGTTVPKNITVSSPGAAIKVLPLPTQGRPPDFSGAVGTFKIGADVSSAKNTAGDPLTLRMHVTGSGNFDRVDSNMLEAGPEWKTYEPKATFSSTDPTGFRGEKTFEQPLIASQPGAQTVPSLSFSYFDPGTHSYETARSAPLPVLVSPAANSAANEPPPLSAAAPALAKPAATPADQAHAGLRPDHAATDAHVDSLVPAYFQARFTAVPSLMVLLFGSGWMALRRRERNAQDVRGERERLRSQAIRDLTEQMATASAQRDAASFFTSARAALQHTLNARWPDIPPEHITLVDLDARLDGHDKQDIREIFTLADEANYSGHALTTADFERWTKLVQRQIKRDTPS